MKVMYVSIGRNIGEHPMLSRDWLDFKMDVHDVLTDWFGQSNIIQRPWLSLGASDQCGVWDGLLEQASTWVVAVDDATPLIQASKYELAAIAYDYEQAAIAVTVGESELVFAQQG